MVIRLNSHVLDALGLHPFCSEEELLQGLFSKHQSGFLNIFYSDSSIDELLKIATNGCEDIIEVKKPLVPFVDWQYHLITSEDGSEIVEVVHVPENGIGVVNPPTTDAERLLARAWHLEPSVVVNSYPLEQNFNGNRVVLFWKPRYWSSIEPKERQTIHTLLRACDDVSHDAYDPGWWNKSPLVISNNSVLLKTQSYTDTQLFRSAISENSTPWRFISFFRILERGYLTSLYEQLKREFFKAPLSSILDAKKNLESEVSQLQLLIEGHRLQPFFERYMDSVNTLAGNGNRYCTYLIKCIKDASKSSAHATSAAEKYKTGVMACYKTRCSVVHSGTHDIVYDSYEDAEDALKELTPHLEEAILFYLGVYTPTD